MATQICYGYPDLLRPPIAIVSSTHKGLESGDFHCTLSFQFHFDLAIKMSLLSPPSEEYATSKDFLQSVQSWAVNQGYAVVIA